MILGRPVVPAIAIDARAKVTPFFVFIYRSQRSATLVCWTLPVLSPNQSRLAKVTIIDDSYTNSLLLAPGRRRALG